MCLKIYCNCMKKLVLRFKNDFQKRLFGKNISPCSSLLIRQRAKARKWVYQRLWALRLLNEDAWLLSICKFALTYICYHKASFKCILTCKIPLKQWTMKILQFASKIASKQSVEQLHYWHFDQTLIVWFVFFQIKLSID